MFAPIVLFAYNRPEHTRNTLESLMANDLANQSTLFIYADGPKGGVPKDKLEKIKKTRDVIREKQWCREVHIIERDKNIGLANSMIKGVTEIVNKYGKIIVLEDDLILSKKFLKYMNDSLERYENEEKVMQISGYMYPVDAQTNDADASFLPFISSWGWATWKRSWSYFDADMPGLTILKDDSSLRKKFDLNNSYPYFKMLLMQKKGKIDSWAIRFYLNVFLNNGLVLFPKKTLVSNDGFDGSGVHCRVGIKQKILGNSFNVNNFPNNVDIDGVLEKNIHYFLKIQSNFFMRIAIVIIMKIKSI